MTPLLYLYQSSSVRILLRRLKHLKLLFVLIMRGCNVCPHMRMNGLQHATEGLSGDSWHFVPVHTAAVHKFIPLLYFQADMRSVVTL